MSNREVDKWLGDKFEEKEEIDYQGMFAHDVPLQRSLSLDGGMDIFKHLQAIGSKWSISSDGSVWTVHSEERLFFEQYKSLEDIPASQIRMKSRRASSEVDSVTAGRCQALMVLRDSYKGVDAGGSQIKKLQRCYTVSGSFETFKEAMKKSGESLSGSVSPLGRIASGSKVHGGVSPQRPLRRSFSLRDAAEHFEVQYALNDDDGDYLEIRVPSYRNISIETKGLNRDVEHASTRQRKVGVFDSSFQGIKREPSLRKEVMIKNVECTSCENVSIQRGLISRSGSSSKIDMAERTRIVLRRNVSSRSIKQTFSSGGPGVRDIMVPKIVISDVDTPIHGGVAKIMNVIPTNTSNSVEISRICDCQICMDDAVVKKCFVRRMFGKLLVKIITCRDYGRKLTYWDENNNFNENEMYKCIMNILKLMLGLWLRHLDHN
ncbi:uncharacterized protein LOC115455633 [Manduca sexta]|uniref:uncharacterized protein LOC115455633 n=1 Tax=Manduca sexta TaxID=7130 RepID=UPI00188E5A3A|nr:uncharacterized protein LOC115455633 [Manduca sexta]